MRSLHRLLILPALVIGFALAASATPAWASETTAVEQQFIYELNEARRDPAAYAAAHLSGSTATLVAGFQPRPPVSVSDVIGTAAQARTDDMIENRYFAHSNPTTGFGPTQALALVDYSWSSWGENIGLGYLTPVSMLNGFLNSNSGHRESVMGQGSVASTFREIGVGHRSSTGVPGYSNVWTVILTRPQYTAPALTGVVFDDVNGNGRMDLGEGLPGVTVKAGTAVVQTNAGGGWAIPITSGTWTITASGGGLPSVLQATATMGSANVWVELESEPLPDPRSEPCGGGVCDAVGLVDAGGQWRLWDGLDVGDGMAGFYFGNPGDVPFMGDWDGDGTATPGLYRRSDGYVYLRNSNTQGNADIRFFFGNPGDLPVAGDFNGNGRDTVSIYRPSNQTIYVINQLGSNDGGLGAADYSFVFGNPGDVPFVGDFDGDGRDTVGLYRQSSGFVYFRNSLSTGIADLDFYYGNPGDVILAGDWDGDGDDTVAVYRPSDGRVYVNLRNAPTAADYYVYVGSYANAVTWRRN